MVSHKSKGTRYRGMPALTENDRISDAMYNAFSKMIDRFLKNPEPEKSSSYEHTSGGTSGGRKNAVKEPKKGKKNEITTKRQDLNQSRKHIYHQCHPHNETPI